MTKEEYIEYIENYYKTHQDDFCGIHDCHSAKDENALAKKIIDGGLRVSRASQNVENQSFRTTFYFVTENIASEIFCLPKCPLFIRIPKPLLMLLGKQSCDEYAYHDFCGFGFEESDGEGERKITPLRSSENANVRLLPPYLIDGYIDIESGEFVENPMAYDRLTSEEQEIVRSEILSGNARCLCDNEYIFQLKNETESESF